MIYHLPPTTYFASITVLAQHDRVEFRVVIEQDDNFVTVLSLLSSLLMIKAQEPIYAKFGLTAKHLEAAELRMM